MFMKLYLFNPDTELALAVGKSHYLPPRSIGRMAADLALLPLWYADAGAIVLLRSEAEAAFLQQMQRLFDIPVEGVSERLLPNTLQPLPWGWNLSLRRHCQELGISESSLPSVEEVERHRDLSSRQAAVEWLSLIGRGLPGCCGEATVLQSVEACAAYAARCPHCLFKQPWSSSGKGLRWSRGTFGVEDARWCGRAIATQGCVVASPLYNKVCDLAMEFRRQAGGGVEFTGYSLFETNGRGAYLGNRLLAGECAAETHLQQWVSVELLHEVRRRWMELLARIDDPCMDYVGVDMMVCRTAEGYRLHPCIEVNLRMNMGVLACLFARRYLAEGSEGILRIEGFPSTEALLQAHRTWQREAPLLVEYHRLQSGYLPLVPVTAESRMLAYVRV